MNKNKNHQQVFRILQPKKGEMSTQQIVVLIILIASFAILLFFLARLNLGQTTEREVCRNSVLMRGSSVLPADSVPLNCKRSYVCLTSDGSCESLTKPRKEKVQTKDEVYEVLANEMADCWWMFGEGKINYVGSDFREKLYCSICTQVAFDDSVGQIFEQGVIDENYFYNTYLANKNVPGKDITYLEYLYGTNDFSLIHSGSFKDRDLSKQQYVMIGIISKESTFKRVVVGVGAAATITAVALLTPITGPVALVSTTGILATGGSGIAGGIYMGVTGEGPTGEKFLKPTIIEANSEEFKALDCKSITTLA